MYKFSCKEIPDIQRYYSIIRKSTWQAVEASHSIFYIKKGKCLFDINNVQYCASEGDFIFIPKNTLHTRSPLGDEFCSIVGIHFDCNGNICSEDDLLTDLKTINTKIEDVDFDSYNEINCLDYFYVHTYTNAQDKKNIIEKLISDSFDSQVSFQYYDNISISTLVFQILAILSEKSISFVKGKFDEYDIVSLPERLRRAIVFIQQHYGENITLEEICSQCFISKVQINRLFKTHLNISPVNYLISYRINKARNLLQNSPMMSIKEISSSVGYLDQCYFSRIFTKIVGISPSEFRSRTLNFDEKKHIENNNANTKN